MGDRSETFHYIVVGAGSAGCVVASRLAQAGHRVLLLEQGGRNDHWTVRMPGATGENYKPGSRYMMWRRTEGQPGLGDRSVDLPFGLGLGGSSLVNGMVFLRGHPDDFAHWGRLGVAGWTYADVLPWYVAIERWQPEANRSLLPHGPVGVRLEQDLEPLNQAFLDAGGQAGHQVLAGGSDIEEGVMRFPMNVDDGMRASSAFAYLECLASGQRPTVVTGTVVDRLLLDGNRVVGVVARRGKRTEIYRTQGEVILSSGAVGSPRILMLSGIGNGDALRSMGIVPCLDLPGVGANLHDHLELDLQWAAPMRYTLNRHMRPHCMAMIGFTWLLFRRGLGATNQVHVGAFLRSSDAVAAPDVQFHFAPVYMDGWLPRPDISGFRIGAGPSRPSSRGRVALRSADPRDGLILDPNYLATEHDRETMRASYRLILDIVSQAAFEPFRGAPIDPPELPRTKRALDQVIARYTGAGFHLVGTCRMGSENDPEAVVDSSGRVLGMESLRIIDGSILPAIVTANPNCTIMMMAERLSAAITDGRLT